MKDIKKRLLAFWKSVVLKPVVHDKYWTGIEIDKALHRNGTYIERARIEGRSLSYEERQVIFAVRRTASDHGLSQEMIRMTEMEGERNRDLIFKPVKVSAKFAFYNSGERPGDPIPEYHIVESNHPALILHGNYSEGDLQKFNIKIPKTPTFEKWDKIGRPVFRG